MNLVVYAVPFFVLAILIELIYGVVKGRNTYRMNDAAGSVFMGTPSQARRFAIVGVGGYVYYLVTAYFSLPLMDTSSWFTWVLAFVLATAVTAALWLQGYDTQATAKWELLRLACLFAILLLGWQAGFDTITLAILAVYGVINLVTLPLVRRAAALLV